jgi:hypothetical protein
LVPPVATAATAGVAEVMAVVNTFEAAAAAVAAELLGVQGVAVATHSIGRGRLLLDDLRRVDPQGRSLGRPPIGHRCQACRLPIVSMRSRRYHGRTGRCLILLTSMHCSIYFTSKQWYIFPTTT